MAMLLEKVTQLADAQQGTRAAATTTAEPVSTEARLRPPRPTPPAEKRGRSRTKSREAAEDTNGEVQASDAQRSRSSQ